MIGTTLIAIFIVALTLSGAGILGLMRKLGRMSIVEGIAMSFGTGAGSIALILFYCNLLGLKIDWLLLIVTLTPLSVIGLVAIVKILLSSRPKAANEKEHLSLPQTAGIVLIAVFVLLTIIKATILPMRCFDDRAKWSYKAKIIYYEDGVSNASFSDEARLHIDRRYPLLMPIIEAAAHLAMGRFDDRKVKIIFPIFYAAIIGLLFGAAKSSSSRKTAVLFALAYAAIPFLGISPIEEGGSADTGYADLPLSFFYAASVFYLYRWRTWGEGLAVSSAFIAFALFTKQEGMILYASWFISLALFGMKRPRMHDSKMKLPAIFLSAAIPVALLVPFVVYAASLPAGGIDYAGNLKVSNIIANAGRIPLIFLYFADTFFSFRWGFLGVPLLAAVLMFPGRSMKLENLSLLSLIFLPLLCYSVLLIVTPAAVYWQLAVAFDRLLIHVAPVIVFFILQVYSQGEGKVIQEAQAAAGA